MSTNSVAAGQHQALSANAVQRYNQISAYMEVLERQSAFHRTRIAGIDTVMRDIVGTIVNVAEEQFQLLSTFLQEPPERRNTVVLQAMMKQRMDTIRDNAVQSYSDILNAREAIMEGGSMLTLSRDKKIELVGLFKQKINILLQQYQDQNGGLKIDPSTDLAALKLKMQNTLDIYERMLDSKVPLINQMEKVETEMKKLRIQRQALFAGPLNVWTACERGDITYLKTEMAKLWKLGLAAALSKGLTREEYVNQPNQTKSTPLHIACTSRQLPVVQFLLQNGANMLARDEEGYTPLHKAAQVGDIAIATELFRKGCPVDVLDSLKNRTPLHNAAFHGRVEMIRFLLAQGANINAQTNAEGTCLTPLHDAVRMDRAEVVALFTRYEALDVLRRDKHGQTALEYALIGGMIINAALIVGHPSWKPGKSSNDPDHISTLLKIKIPENKAEIEELLISQDPVLYAKPGVGAPPAAASPIKPFIPTKPPSKPAPLFEFVYGGSRYKRCVTKGDGFCAVHALLGKTNENQIFEWEGSRHEIGEQLKRAWKEKHADLIHYFRAFFEGLSQHVGKGNSEYDPLLTSSEKLREPLQELQKNLKAVQGKVTEATEQRDLLDRFIEAHLDIYLQIFEQQDYFLTHTELEMIARVRGKNVLILSNARVDKSKPEQQKVDNDAIVIWHEGLHYERCEVMK
ncbi:MAG: ankyrin repeat domain-containing protein [Parachlamydia sp.]|nr:ankyrin repeat domain-containing protein [Parachlamydia sp.]